MGVDPKDQGPAEPLTLDDILEDYMSAPEPGLGDESPTMRRPFESHLAAVLGEAYEKLGALLGVVSGNALQEEGSRAKLRAGLWRVRTLLQEAEAVLQASGERPAVVTPPPLPKR